LVTSQAKWTVFSCRAGKSADAVSCARCRVPAAPETQRSEQLRLTLLNYLFTQHDLEVDKRAISASLISMKPASTQPYLSDTAGVPLYDLSIPLKFFPATICLPNPARLFSPLQCLSQSDSSLCLRSRLQFQFDFHSWTS